MITNNLFYKVQSKKNDKALLATQFAPGNGYVGFRAVCDEDSDKTERGLFINGFYERIPMVHSEFAHGFPEVTDRMVKLPDWNSMDVFIDGVKLNPDDVLKRTYHFDLKSGVMEIASEYKNCTVISRKIADFEKPNYIASKTIIHGEGQIRAVLKFPLEVYSGERNRDPRKSGSEKLYKTHRFEKLENGFLGEFKTLNSNLISRITQKVVSNGTSFIQTENEMEVTAVSNLEIDRITLVEDSIRGFYQNSVDRKYADIKKAQTEYLARFWEENFVVLNTENNNYQKYLNFLIYHLLQATARDKYSNISAKGLTGDGYEGHYFWDTEIYMYPVWLVKDPDRAKTLLEYRYHILDYARKRSKELGYNKGATYAWRTISGIECSGYMPAGTAQYHLSGDIAYAAISYYFATGDYRALVDYIFEMVFETARTFYEIGNFTDDKFHINAVTGPDEYTAIVNDNYYTNAIAKYNFEWAVKLYKLIETTSKDDLNKLIEKLRIEKEEVTNFQNAFEAMVLLTDDKALIDIQDNSFVQKELWPDESVYDPSEGLSDDHEPLLMNYHPLIIYRHKILKQVEVVLAHFLLKDYTNKIKVDNSFYYYKALTTHDSSLSYCIHSLMGLKVGFDRADDYFLNSLELDIKNLHGNTADGMHMANIGGAIMNVLYGYLGMHVKADFMEINPVTTDRINGIETVFHYNDSKFLIKTGDKTELSLLAGEGAKFSVRGKEYTVTKDNPNVVHGDKAVLFDLDGVLTDTGELHYQAWKKLMNDEFAIDLPVKYKDLVRGISRLESMELILTNELSDRSFSEERKVELANRKNEIYKSLIEHFTPDDLYDGVEDLLKGLKKEGVFIALCSSSKNGGHLIYRLGIDNYFDAVVNPSFIERGKPAPDIFEKALKMLGVNAENAIGVEDAEAGIQAINSANIRSVGFGDNDMLKEADVVFDNISDLSRCLLNWSEDKNGWN